MKNLFTYLKALWGAWGNLQSNDVSLDCRLTVGSPSGFNSKRMLKLVSVLVLMLTVGVGQMWGQGTEGFEGFASSSTSYSSRSWTGNNGVSSWAATNARNDYTITGTYALTFKKDNSCTITMKLTTAQKNAGIGTLSFKYKYPVNVSDAGNTISVTLNNNTHSTSITNPGNTSTVKNGSITINETLSSTTVTINIGSGGRICIDDLSWTAKPASCSANPSIGDASLNGSISLSSIPLSIGGVGGGTDCTLAEYGFVWKASSAPSASDNKTKIGESSSATSFTGNITGSFSTGVTYYIKGYAINNGSNTKLSDNSLTITPRSVTFNLNGHGSSTPSVQYVNNGGKATDPSYSESVTGYTFGGWYKEAGCSNSWTFGTDEVSGGNKTLYAKWTAKNYTITLDPDLTPTTAGTTSITATYNSNNNLTSAITTPIKTGWTFAGYYTAKNGGGTQIIDADGNVLASKAGYTDDSKNWIGTSDVTLYAKWTCTVTWSVNNLTNVYSAQTLTYNGTSTKVASVPGPPSPATYCGDKFMGWTTEANVSQNDDTGLNLFTNVAGSPELKTVGNTTFYAVFADYGE